MAEEESTGRKSKVNRFLVEKIFETIGLGNKLPKRVKSTLLEQRPVSFKRHYLTMGEIAKSYDQLEERWRDGYRVACISTQKPQSPSTIWTRRRRGNFKSLQTYRSRLDAHKLERLFVPSDSRLPGRSITEDIDPEYYSIVGGREVKERGTLADHKWAVRATLLTRLSERRVVELMENMQQAEEQEMNRFLRADTHLRQQIALWDQFLEEDYKSSADLLEQAQAAEQDSRRIEEVKEGLMKELDAVKSRVALLEEEWRVSKMHQQFLYSVSPLQWRRLHDYIHSKDRETTDPVHVALFKRLRGASLTAKDEMSSKISRFFGEKRQCETPALYFTDPAQLFDVFKDLEERNIISLIQCEQLQPAVLAMRKVKDNVEARLEEERTQLAEDVAELEDAVIAEEARASKLEQEVHQLCEQHLHPLLTNRAYISLTAALEHAYERVVGPNDNKLDLVEMMRSLETTHERLRVELDLLPTDLVTRISAAWERENTRVMNEAKDAAKKVHQMEMLTKRFSNALKPWTRRATRKTAPRSQPRSERKVKKPQPPALSAEELEQKIFFEEKEKSDDDMFRPMC